MAESSVAPDWEGGTEISSRGSIKGTLEGGSLPLDIIRDPVRVQAQSDLAQAVNCSNILRIHSRNR